MILIFFLPITSLFFFILLVIIHFILTMFVFSRCVIYLLWVIILFMIMFPFPFIGFLNNLTSLFSPFLLIHHINVGLILLMHHFH